VPRIRVVSDEERIRDVLENRSRFAVVCDRVENVEPILPDGCAHLMPIDGPYHGVKSHGWDNEHRSDADFLNWKRERYAAWKRILAPNGTLYDFAAARIGSRVEVTCSETFDVIARITWAKTLKHTPAHYKIRKESLRTYFPNTETIVMAEQRGSDSIALGESQYGVKCDELRGFVFEPLRAYLDSERERAGFDRAACDKTCGNQMSGHYFSRIQWALPTRKNYDKLREAFNANGGDFLARPYEELRTQYEELRTQYEELRRPFNVTAKDQYTDVWTYTTVKPYDGKHPCEKPENMARDIVRISSRPNDVVLVFFAGSGIFASEALKQGRRVIAVEMDPHWAVVTERRCIEALA
jgi:site-specific DNA-methyltransferase (adenine-specific)